SAAWMNPLHKAIVSRICGELIRPSLALTITKRAEKFGASDPYKNAKPRASRGVGDLAVFAIALLAPHRRVQCTKRMQMQPRQFRQPSACLRCNQLTWSI
ncbi:hypothetical protein, partial [Xanthomonas phaseoli]|uniref:hypothetical protein n=1 Tax=Xanthomonas phaseoli TaxID=1985254 RepID=UPI001ED950EA